MASFFFLDSTPKDLDERAYPWLLNGLVRGYQA